MEGSNEKIPTFAAPRCTEDHGFTAIDVLEWEAPFEPTRVDKGRVRDAFEGYHSAYAEFFCLKETPPTPKAIEDYKKALQAYQKAQSKAKQGDASLEPPVAPASTHRYFFSSKGEEILKARLSPQHRPLDLSFLPSDQQQAINRLSQSKLPEISLEELAANKNLVTLDFHLQEQDLDLLRSCLGEDGQAGTASAFNVIKSPQGQAGNYLPTTKMVALDISTAYQFEGLLNKLNHLKGYQGISEATKARLNDIIQALKEWKQKANVAAQDPKPLEAPEQFLDEYGAEVNAYKKLSGFQGVIPKDYDPSADEVTAWYLGPFDDSVNYFALKAPLFPADIDLIRFLMQDTDNVLVHAAYTTDYSKKGKSGIYYFEDNLLKITQLRDRLLVFKTFLERPENSQKYATTLVRVNEIIAAVENELPGVTRRDFHHGFSEGLPTVLCFGLLGVGSAAALIYRWWNGRGGGNGPGGNGPLEVVHTHNHYHHGPKNTNRGPIDVNAWEPGEGARAFPPSNRQVYNFNPNFTNGTWTQQMEADYSRAVCDPKTGKGFADSFAYQEYLDTKYAWVDRTLHYQPNPQADKTASLIMLGGAALGVVLSVIDGVPGDEPAAAGAFANGLRFFRAAWTAA